MASAKFDPVFVRTPACSNIAGCQVCRRQYRSQDPIDRQPSEWPGDRQPYYVSQLSVEEAKEKAAHLIKPINTIRQVLLLVIDKHGDTLLARCKGKTQAQRRELILRVRPQCLSN
jgi:hypothetical protein